MADYTDNTSRPKFEAGCELAWGWRGGQVRRKQLRVGSPVRHSPEVASPTDPSGHQGTSSRQEDTGQRRPSHLQPPV